MAMETTEFETATAVKIQTYSLEVLTPLLMHGWQEAKDGRNKPIRAEVRTTSLKGVFRYWWRAIQPQESWRQLREQEIELFGGISANEEKGNRAPFQLRLPEQVQYPDPTDINKVIEANELVLVHRPTPKQSFKTFGIPAGKTFQLTLQVFKRHEKKLDTYSNIIRLSILLGQFGQRARRGFGALQLGDMKWDSREQLGEELLKLLAELNPSFQKNWIVSIDWQAPQLLTTKSARTDHPVLRSLFLGGACPNARDATYKLNQASHIVTKEHGYILGKSKPREASPLLGKVIKIGDAYHPLIAEVHTGEDFYQQADYQRAKQKFQNHCL